MRWKTLPILDNTYEVSEYGDIRRLKKGTSVPKGKVLKHTLDCTYHKVKLYDNKRYLVHRLVLMTFIGPCPKDKPNALHRDDNRNNNHIDNLYWGNTCDNMKDAKKNGKILQKRNHPRTKITSELSKKILNLNDFGWSQRKIGRKLGLVHATVGKIIRKEHWIFDISDA